jgi:3-deoxy-manno-octulosonate cytidylyltransferase (CMP-KDO synthetase)
VAEIFQWHEDDIIVNLQGDEPLIPAEYISLAAQSLAMQSTAGVATLAAEIIEFEEIFKS